MAVLHKEYISFHSEIKLSSSKEKGLLASRDAIRARIKEWFKEKKPKELNPKFNHQGSIVMKTAINPITEKDSNGKNIYKYDLDDGVYFIDETGENNRPNLDTLHGWIVKAVDTHTGETTKDKTTCVRVMFADGHHIDLPMYYKQSNDDLNDPELAHKSKGWITSDPRAFYKWFNEKEKDQPQLRKIVRYLKAWKNYRETEVSSLKLPSGFALTILATNNFVECDNDDESFRKTVAAIKNSLDISYVCYRPTTPVGEDIFSDDSDTFKSAFLTNLESLSNACKNADNENNFKKASEYLRKQLGERFPQGKDEEKSTKSNRLSSVLAGAAIAPKPYSPADD